jgi:predicted TIM-barrel fold metal-dependent hydrolase
MGLPEKDQAWIIDGDGHIREPDRLYTEFIAPEFSALRPRLETEGNRARYAVGDVRGGWRTSRIAARQAGGKDSSPLPEMQGEWEPKARLADMAMEGIGHAVLFPTEAMAFGCIEDPRAARALSRGYNDWLGEFCAAAPDRLHHVAHIPFVAVQDAVTELARCKTEYGSVAAYVRPNPYPPYSPTGKFLSDRANEEFWHAAEELEVAVCLHEAALLVMPTFGMDRFTAEEYFLIHAAAHPLGQMMAMLELIGRGVLERHPRLRIGFLEAGAAWIPGWLGRLDEHVETWAGGEILTRPPSQQFREQCFVSTEGEEPGLALCANLYPNNIIFASDYPHADCKFPGATDDLLKAEDLTDDEKYGILRANAVHWYRIGVS